jgi:hypothetical protein
VRRPLLLLGAALLSTACAAAAPAPAPSIQNTLSPYCVTALAHPAPPSEPYTAGVAAYRACQAQREDVQRVPVLFGSPADPGPSIRATPYIPTGPIICNHMPGWTVCSR